MSWGLALGGFPLGLSELGGGPALDPDITFDGPTSRIILALADVSAARIWSAWVKWHGANTEWPLAFRQVGGDDLGGGLSIPPYYFLQGAWRVRPMESSHNLTITGNLFVEGGGVPVVSTIGVYQVNVNYTVPVQAQAVATTGGGGGGATAAEVWSYGSRTLTNEALLATLAKQTEMLAALAGDTSRLADIWQRLGLDPSNPQTTTATSITAGGVVQSISEAAGAVTVTRAP